MIDTSLTFDNESDVEQKFVFPLLTAREPNGLGYHPAEVRTKPNIRKYKIDKGRKEKYYFPDYLILKEGIPYIIVEAKTPDESLDNAFREARLYASELNSSFSNKINPCSKIIITNGINTVAGYWDSDNVEVEITLSECEATNPKFVQFIEFLGNTSADVYISELKAKLRSGATYLKPVYMLGGRVSAGERIPDNSFGVNLALDYKYLFNPETEDDRGRIIHNAYVESKKRLSHVNPIDRLIRSIITPSKEVSTEFADTSQPTEITNRFRDLSKIRKQICLLIGSVGSGKSTFVDYLKNKALSDDILCDTAWLTLNLNDAPVSRDLIYSWCTTKLVDLIKRLNGDIDFEDIEVIRSIFHQEETTFAKGVGKLLKGDEARYNIELYNIIKKSLDDSNRYFEAILEFIYLRGGILPIIVLDNSDKRNRDEQLLMFEVANWLRDQFNCMIFLPIRETTYDLYRNEPPLDTVIKDLVFRIDPPLLEKVIQKRIDYALREISEQQTSFYYYLPNGIRIECPRREVSNYLRCILHTLFQNRFFKKLMIGLTGRNIRKGLEIFLDFCKSGFLDEDLILKMRSASNAMEIPNHIVSTIMLRGQKRFYDERSALIKNLFYCDPKREEIPDYFSRYHILNWLNLRKREHGPTAIKGYHMVQDMIQDLVLFGHSHQRLVEDLEFLMKEEYIISETQEYKFEPRNLISITSAGVVLLELTLNVDYLATVSEDTYYRTNQEPKSIARVISGTGRTKQLSRVGMLENSGVLIKYLNNYLNNNWINSSAYSAIDFNDVQQRLGLCRDMIDRGKRKDRDYVDYEALKQTYPEGMEVEGQITGKQDYGIFFEFGLNAVGFASESSLSRFLDWESEFEIGHWKSLKIVSFNPTHNKFDVEVI